MLWKFTLIGFTKVDTEGKKFDSGQVRKWATRRMINRLTAYQHKARQESKKARARGRETRRGKHGRLLEPLAELTEEDELRVNDEILKQVQEEGWFQEVKGRQKKARTEFYSIAREYEENNPCKPELHSWLEEEPKRKRAHDENTRFVKRKYK